ncbi:c-type cytochrome [Sphingomonas flavalba]|uniref:c-type cytochrome n=1 Tax=Sphingomonas flavalba TaxID=2559804 RepID=UPI00109E08E9|nr:c-type cytochrome [Sphingomonas flavalba]
MTAGRIFPVIRLAAGIAALCSVAPAAAQQAAAGATLFKRCAICHSVTPGKGVTLGPNLAGIVGRKAGAQTGFTYSKAMAGAPFKWDQAKLDAFLARPQAVVPGNRMAFAGMSNTAERAQLIAYLKTLGK